ncbi:MAG: hypothetical protein JKY20_07525 [Alphaproteobacteria bacterium]|nr:hypothetical protein [Alphaproteobacteria bacterium]
MFYGRPALTDNLAMLLEAIEYALTPAPSWARRSGLLHDLIAVKGRYRRHRCVWEPHLDNTRSAILAAAALCVRNRTALILGSGALYDIPLAPLCDQFEQVVLIDAVHPWRARRIARRQRNAIFAHVDLSGVYDALLLGVAHGADSAPEPRISSVPDIEPTDVDLVISANLLSQLPLAPVEFMHRHVTLSPDAETRFARTILQAHLDYIAGFSAVTGLITDRTRQTLDRDGSVLRASDALYGLALPAPDREWIWDIAPLGELSRHESSHNHVHAILTPAP